MKRNAKAAPRSMKAALKSGAVLGALALAAALGACQPQSAKQALPEMTQPDLISRAALFGNPERTQARISPKGDYISYLAPRDGYLNVFVAATGSDLTQATPITNDAKRGIRQHFWAKNGTHILFLQDEGGDENWRLYSVDVKTGEKKDLTPLKGVQAQVIGMSAREPDAVLVGLNDRDSAWHDVYKINVVTGRRALVERNNEEFTGFVADQDNILRLATKNLPDGKVEFWSFNLQGRWSKLMEAPFEDSLTTVPLSFEGDGKHFLMFDSVGRDKAALVRVDAATGNKTPIGEHPKADVSDVWIDPQNFTAEAFAGDYLKTEWTALNDEAKADLEFLRTNLRGEANVVDRTGDDSKWIVVDDGPQTPPTSYLYDRTAKTITKLFEQRPALAKAPLAAMIPVEIKSSDGLDLVSYLTLPPGTDLDNNSRPDKPLPLVLNVHGGPWARDSYGLDPEHQWLANRGYAVLSVNFRGSTGFGKAFVNAGNREWAGKMHDDLIDAVNWAVKDGVTTQDKVAIYGGSYGGYATLVGLTKTPETFACGVSIVGPSNLKTLFDSIPAYWESFRNELYLRVGDPRTPEGEKMLAERSPLNFADKIVRPLLVAQGANDPRVKQAESDQIVAAMKAKSIPVTYVLYPDEGHGFGRPQNRMSFYAISEAFLSKCLGGRYEPVGTDFSGASLQVLEGAPLVPGLAEAVAALNPAPAAPAPATPAPTPAPAAPPSR
jgi:dipeptidyl aminopeptidase/acylaminoacyl peptidase